MRTVCMCRDRLLVCRDRLLVYKDRLLMCGDRLLVYGDRLLVCGDRLLVRGPSARVWRLFVYVRYCLLVGMDYWLAGTVCSFSLAFSMLFCTYFAEHQYYFKVNYRGYNISFISGDGILRSSREQRPHTLLYQVKEWSPHRSGLTIPFEKANIIHDL